MSCNFNTANQLIFFKHVISFYNNNRAPVLSSKGREKRATGNRATFSVEEAIQINCLHNLM